MAGIFTLTHFSSSPSKSLDIGHSSAITNQNDVTLISKIDPEELKWNELDFFLQGIGTNAKNVGEFIDKTSASSNPPTQFIRGLLLLVSSKPQDALRAFDAIPIESIPPAYLYPPYRLHNQYRPNETNRYTAPLLASMDTGALDPLIRARVYAREGDFQNSLTSYLQTDPALWKNHDVECFALLFGHEGYRSEVVRLLVAAFKSKRVPAGLIQKLIDISKPNTNDVDIQSFLTLLNRELALESAAGKTALESIQEILENRSLFIQKNYLQLLEKYTDSNPVLLTDETALLLFLSSLRNSNLMEVARWSQELKRRFPERSVKEWIDNLVWKGN